MTRHLSRFIVAAICASAASTAWAQTPTPGAGSFIIEEVEQGVVFAPDVRVTEVDGRTAVLAGGYIGWLSDRTWLVGGGGYWLANQEDDLEMAYGGMVLEWQARGHERIGFGIRGLVGGGGATLGSTYGDYFGLDDIGLTPDPRSRNARYSMRGGHGPRAIGADTRILVHEYFFVVEPQANVIVQLTRWARLDLGVGYRATAGAGSLDDELSGASASVAIQFGGGRRSAKP
jgi:hypothetical protein